VALKKSELYSSLWSSCDALRGGMDASQYKDYVLVLLFIKYVSDKYAGQPYAPITIPPGASFQDMVALKGTSDIGDQINKKIIGPLASANKLSDMPDFNDVAKLGSGKEMVERLTTLIAIFENKALDFSRNRADGDDLLGDAYEYRNQLKAAVAPMIERWQSVMGVVVAGFYIRHMKTKWGSCNPRTGTIRLNTELAKKPRECLEYIVVHEMVHLLEPTHNARFIETMDRFMANWRLRRDQLNRLPVRHEEWVY